MDIVSKLRSLWAAQTARASGAGRPVHKELADGDNYCNAYSPEHFGSTPQFDEAPPDVLEAILLASKKHKVDPYFSGSVSQHESDARFARGGTKWDKNYRSFDGGVGLFQLTPARGRSIGNPAYDKYTDDELRDPYLNADLGVKLLADNIAKARTRVPKEKVYRDAYLMYNAGPSYHKAPRASIKKFAERVDRVMGILGRTR